MPLVQFGRNGRWSARNAPIGTNPPGNANLRYVDIGIGSKHWRGSIALHSRKNLRKRQPSAHERDGRRKYMNTNIMRHTVTGALIAGSIAAAGLGLGLGSAA